MLAAVICLELTPLLAASFLALLAALLRVYAPRRRRRVLAVGLLATAILLAAVAWQRQRASTWGPNSAAAIETAYRSFWQDLRRVAASAAGRLEIPGDDPAAIVAAFDAVDALARRPELANKALLLVNPAGEVVAWAGAGLLHEPAEERLPRDGSAFIQSYTAATAVVVVPLGNERRPWRAVVGRSLSGAALPFAGAAAGTAKVRWALRAPGSVLAAGERAFAVPGAPSLVISRPSPQLHEPGAERLARAAALTLALTILALALAGTERRPQRRTQRNRLLNAVAFGGAASSAAVAAALGPRITLALVLSAALGTYGVASCLGVRRRRLRVGQVAAAGVMCILILVLGGWLLQSAIGARSLSDAFTGGAEVMVLRLTWLLAGLGLLGLAARRHQRAVGEGGAWLAAATVLAGAMAHDRPLLALPLLATGGAVAAVWLGAQRRLDRNPAAIGIGLVLTSMLAAAAWDTAYRLCLRHAIRSEIVPRLGPPTSAELSKLNLDFDAFFQRFDLRRIEPPGQGETAREDLAFALWRHSPLAGRDGLSALIVEARSGATSVFHFDLPLDREELPVPGAARLRVPPDPAWTANVIEGRGSLRNGDDAAGVARYGFLPRPGFRLAVSEDEELETELLRGRPHRRPADGLPEGVAYALYRDDGSVIESPWPQAPPLQAAVRDRSSGVVSTPGGRAWFWTHRDRDGVTVLYLPRLRPLDALARTGVHALATLAVLVLLALVSLVFRQPRHLAAAALRRTVRSYARRLMLVYTGLLFLPLVALNLVLLGNMAERLRQNQLTQGEIALDSARTVLIDYIRGLDEGFSFDLLLNRQLVEWLSRIVDHQVNLYWNGQLVGSSQEALVTAGLMPGRVPGDIYARLAYLGYERELRSRAHDALTYLELYAPVKLAGSTPFVLSVPLLEQQEAAARLLDRMRQQAVLISAALFALLVALGGRLARSFTDPLNQLVEGTRRIAGGASSLELEPRELELSALVSAIDDMAHRIADGRSRLLREKQVIERMVESITSGVVSLDREHRVLLHNGVAAKLLGTAVGTAIETQLAAQPHLAPVLAFVAAADPAPDTGALRQTTARIPPHDEGEEREWTLIWVPVPGRGNPSALLVVDDDTEVLRGQRLAAWAEMARMIAHEIKNPLTPIRLSAEHLKQVYARDPEHFAAALTRCTDNILRQVEELRAIASDFSTYSRIPRAELETGDLGAVMTVLADGYRDAGASGGGVVFTTPDRPLLARIDEILITRAVRNLLENALRANGADGDAPVTLTVAEEAGRVVVRVRDRGPGVPSQMLARIFEPYFSTHDGGTGLGLPITRRIVVEHEGTIEARNRAGGGLEVAIALPSARMPPTQAARHQPAIREVPGRHGAGPVGGRRRTP